jgi:hypothetical protein
MFQATCKQVIPFLSGKTCSKSMEMNALAYTQVLQVLS